eukprot:CAMPEP_0173403750 /NCGR_PEP_ID=MMETSP1356-20130122/57565_1 /TAXON_ID=77927 ORGANISM="Hemiselmis virescens, Strain PCC157" /NCGR_SAMPLE_ID=MMETSP1356 /ASSEMBLY_ACC=CAM_ASM_000847 /LENGTH=188 /DNA_ID=CAMNT_0014364321 /DNA_START=182 /DNA_END=744 /DNA_ORIENTATION=-
MAAAEWLRRAAARAWTAYGASLKSHPLRTNMTTASVLTVASDAVAQKFEQRGAAQQHGAGGGLDGWRTASMLGWGAAVNGGMVTLWLGLLEKLFPSRGQTLSRVCQKIVFNQAVASPWLNGGFFGVATARSHNITTAEGRERWLVAWGSKLEKDLPSTIGYSFMVWAPAHFVNFLYVPPHLRVVYTNV